MTTLCGKLTLLAASGTGAALAVSAAKQLIAVFESAGYKEIWRAASDDDSTTILRGFRVPSLDQHWSRVDQIAIGNWNGSTTHVDLAWVVDSDVMQMAGVANAAAAETVQGWQSGTWPSTGVPLLRAVNLPLITSQYQFTGTDDVDIRYIVGPYGWACNAQDGTVNRTFSMARTMGHMYPGRDIGFSSTASLPALPLTPTAPSGSQHYTFEVDGKTLNVTLARSSYATYFDIAQDFTEQLVGWAHARVEVGVSSAYSMRVAIDPDRAPSAGVSSSLPPYVALRYQDANAPVDFRISSHDPTSAVSTGARGTIEVSGEDFPAAGARIGGTVYNTDEDVSSTIEAFGSTSAPLDADILTLATVDGSWDVDDAIDIYPIAMHPEGAVAYGAVYKGYYESDPFSPLGKPGSDIDVVLSDRYGEAQDHIVAGQMVELRNNGMAVALTVGSTTTFNVGCLIENDDTGAEGVVLAKSSTKLLVDTIDTGTDCTVPPWNDGDAVHASQKAASPVPHGAATTTTIAVGGVESSHLTDAGGTPSTRASSCLGWHVACQVTAVSQVGSGDKRTVLTLDLDDGAINSSLLLFPGFQIGFPQRWTRVETGQTPAIGPYSVGSNAADEESDVRRHDVVNIVSDEPSGAPDYDTGSFDLTEYVLQTQAGAYGHVSTGAHPYIRSISAASDTGTPAANGDELQEDQDSERVWVVLNEHTGGDSGASTVAPSRNGRLCIGPGDSDLL